MSAETSLGLAFLAGLLSFLSPCVFPLVPVYAGYLGGRATQTAGAEGVDGTPQQAPLFANGVAFVAGFTAVFVLFYYIFSALSITLFTSNRQVFNIVAGVVILIFALQMLGFLRIPALLREVRLLHASPVPGLAGSLVLGISFGAGWSPCLGPQLGAILTLAQNRSFGGLPFMLVYCAGLAVPFLMVAVLAGRIRPLLQAINRRLNLVNLVAGGLLMIFGLLLITGRITILSTLAPGSPFDL